MNYFIAVGSVIFLAISIFLIWQNYLFFKKIMLLKKINSSPFPKEYEQYLKKIPHYKALPKELKEKIKKKILFFIYTKEFIGVKTEVTEEMKTVIAFYACLMVINFKNECFDNLKTILIYPYEVVTKSVMESGGIFKEGDFILEGQSINDTIVIAWNDAKKEAYHLSSHNVIVHELAHVLDFEDGEADGVPPLPWSKYHKWTSTLFKRFKELQERAYKNRDWGEYKIIGEYAATNEAEFFAVITELFFQKPRSLKKHFPDIYEELKEFYGIDTEKIFGNLEKEKISLFH
ncbi:MAG: zinc-dependent peptidase [Epsilonproteobacteria bacterium]|nr:zinc-dependent peptidase [Campylobacterota bacterium]